MRPSLALLAGVVGLAAAGIVVRYIVFATTAGGSGVMAYIDALCVWDCAWYRTVVESGYDLVPGMRLRPGGANWPFFPLYPSAVSAMRTATQLPVTAAGFLLSSIFIVAAAVFSRPLFGANARAYWLFAILLLVGPFSFLFNTLYAESLFILLTVLVLVMLQRGNYVAAGAFGALLSATRATGVLIVFAILIQALVDHLTAGGRWRDFPRLVLADSRLMLALFLAPIGLFAFMAFLYFRTGDALAFAHIERAWGREFGNPFEALWGALTVHWPLTPDAMVIASWGWAATVGLVLCVVLAIRGRPAAAAFCALCLLVSLSAGVGSMVRFVAGLFPLGVVLAELLAGHRLLFALAVLAAVALDAVLMTGWLRSSLFVM